MAKGRSQSIIPVERIAGRIYLIRNQKAMLDSDLAEIYGVMTGNLNKAVKRTMRRFPEDFIFQLTADEYKALIFQTGISSKGHGGRRKLPWVFTEQGVAMLSSVLRSDRAADVNVAIMRAFVRLRQVLADIEEFSRRLELIDRKVMVLWRKFDAFISPPEPKKKRRVGFVHPND